MLLRETQEASGCGALRRLRFRTDFAEGSLALQLADGGGWRSLVVPAAPLSGRTLQPQPCQEGT